MARSIRLGLILFTATCLGASWLFAADASGRGQAAAQNILGLQRRFEVVPFFWSQHYDVAINYVGHAERWDALDVDGDPSTHDCAVWFRRGDRTYAVATIFRDRESLETEAAMERGREVLGETASR